MINEGKDKDVELAITQEELFEQLVCSASSEVLQKMIGELRPMLLEAALEIATLPVIQRIYAEMPKDRVLVMLRIDGYEPPSKEYWILGRACVIGFLMTNISKN